MNIYSIVTAYTFAEVHASTMQPAVLKIKLAEHITVKGSQTGDACALFNHAALWSRPGKESS